MKYFKLPKEFTEKWLLALKSGNYDQAHSELAQFSNEYEDYDFPPINDSNEKEYVFGYCCLGVAAKICGVPVDEMNGCGMLDELNDDSKALVPLELVANESDSAGSVKTNLPNILAGLNDGMCKETYTEVMAKYPELDLKLETEKVTNTSYVGFTFEQIADFIEKNVETY